MQNTIVTAQFKNWNLTRALPCVPILISTPIITIVLTFTVITSLCFFTVLLPKYTSSGHYCITCLLKKLSHFENLLLSTGSLSALSFPHIYLQLSVVSPSLSFAHCLLMVSSTVLYPMCFLKICSWVRGQIRPVSDPFTKTIGDMVLFDQETGSIKLSFFLRRQQLQISVLRLINPLRAAKW